MRIKKILIVCFALAVTLTMFVYGWYKHSYLSWDLIPYIACVKMYDEDSFEKVHHDTYALIKTYADDAEYHSLERSDEYRACCADTVESLRQQMRMYNVKPAFNGFNYLVHKTGIDELESIYLNAYAFSILIFLITFVFYRSKYDASIAFLNSALAFLCSSGFIVMSVGTPDAMMTFFTVLAVYLMAVKNKLNLGLIIILLTIFIRTDNILRYFLVLAALYMSGNMFGFSFKRSVMWSVAGFAFFAGHGFFFPGINYVTFSYHSNIQRLSYPETANVKLPIFRLLKFYVLNLHNFLEPYYFFQFVPAGYIFFRKRAEILRDKYLLFIAVSAVNTLIHYLIFPQITLRYFYPDILLTIILFSLWIKDKIVIGESRSETT